MSETAVITIVQGRHGHLHNQRRGLERSTSSDFDWIVVAMNDPWLTHSWPPDGSLAPTVLHHPCPGPNLPLAAARNAGARQALAMGAGTLIFLDVDCIPDPELVAGYREALHHTRTANTLVCGPVTYLPPPPPDGYDLTALNARDAPHRARPAPARGELMFDGDCDLFWSLSFALSSTSWRTIGGFCDRYTGYGGEDTDFARKARNLGIGITWSGSARAFHQHHPTQDPPIQHLDSILRNSQLFHQRWNSWPMIGWLEAFVEQGLVARTSSGYARAPASALVRSAVGSADLNNGYRVRSPSDRHEQ